MGEKYKHLLTYIHHRYTGLDQHRSTHRLRKTGHISLSLKPLECERRFMDFLRIIIDGGWIV